VSGGILLPEDDPLFDPSFEKGEEEEERR